MASTNTPFPEIIGTDPDQTPLITAHELIKALTHLLELLSQELAELARHTQSIVVALKRYG